MLMQVKDDVSTWEIAKSLVAKSVICTDRLSNTKRPWKIAEHN